MKLERFKERDKKKLGIIIFTISCIFLIAGVFLYKTFALFQVTDQLNMIEGTVQDVGDVYFAYYIDDVASLSIPEKNTGYIFDSRNSNCTNGATLEWNYEEWGPLVTNLSASRTKCFIRFKSGYSETELNGADPVLTGSLIAVSIADNGEITKADEGSAWYSYKDKKWANAVILKDESQSYNVGEAIPEDAIESYFVWIPRYRYQIFDEGNYPTRTSDTSGLDNNAVQTIQVVFENRDMPVSSGTNLGEWLTHPAFTAFNSNGLWVGKFETGTTLTSDYNVRSANSIQIKPNVSSWRNIQVANAFYTSYDYKRNLDSHMMKNTEWGAVAYLQHSIYGSKASVRINNNSSYITGYAANNEPTCGYTGTNEDCNKYCDDGTCNQPYNTSTGYLASTTGNITGVYDMSGGTWEYVMGVMLDESGQLASGRNSTNHSGFNGTLTCPTCDGDTSGKTSITDGYGWPDPRYYDTYIYQSNDQHFERRILGDATGEMGSFGTAKYLTQFRTISSWYADQAYFVASGYPWFVRSAGFGYGLDTGIFAFSNVYGHAYGIVSFRVVLSPS